MNSILKTAVRLNGLKALLNPVKNMMSISNVQSQAVVARNLWYLSNMQTQNVSGMHSNLCSCGCGSKKGVHTKCKEIFGLIIDF